MSPQAVVFDLGKVVVDWDVARAVGHLFESRAALEAELERIDFFAWNAEQDRGRPWEEGIAAGPDEAARLVFRTYRERIDVAHDRLVPGMGDLLRDLDRAGRPLYALTNGPVEATATMRAQHDVMALFRDVLISAEEGVLKPDPAIYAALCARNGLEPARCLFVDDIERNVEGARAFGMQAVRFTGADALRDALRGRGLL